MVLVSDAHSSFVGSLRHLDSGENQTPQKRVISHVSDPFGVSGSAALDSVCSFHPHRGSGVAVVTVLIRSVCAGATLV